MKSKPNKKAARIAKAAADTAAYTVGGVIRLCFRVIATILLIIITTGLLFACIFAYYVKTSLSTDLDISLSDVSLALSSTIWYKDSDGQYKELQTLYSKENRKWVEYENIPQYLEYAAVAIEDKRFYKHKGVDWYRTLGAFSNMFLSMKNDFGGSTITQQLIKNVTKYDDITVQRKLLEIFRAMEFEKKYTKEEIMEWYLNVIYLGEGCYGVGTASKMYFGKEVWELSLAECASLIGITNFPTLYSPYNSVENNKERQETILWEMYDQGYIPTYEEYIEAVNEELVFQQGETESRQQPIYSYYTEVVIKDVLNDLVEQKGISMDMAKLLLYSGGYQIYACIDMDVQNQIDGIYRDLTALPQPYVASSQQLQSAIVIMDPYTGDILGLTGGVGEKNGNFILNRATETKRPPGSSIKPISVYGPAFDLGLITQTTLVNDSPDIVLSGTSWYPRNAGNSYRGITDIRQGLVSSLNTVAAQILDKLTPQASYEYLTERLGITSLDPDNDVAYAPLSLGQLTNGLTVREITQAFSSFVNDGVMTYGRTYTHVLDSEGNVVLENTPKTIVAFKANTAWNIANMLNAAATYGTGWEANLNTMPTAGKTGTTSDDRDRWFVGFTPYYVAGVWTGYDTPEPMRFYGNPAAQIWKKVMSPLHEGLEYKTFSYPTIGPPTNIFGDLEEDEEEEPSPSPSESPEPSESPSPPPSDSPSPSPSPSPTPSPSPSATVPPTSPPPTETQNPGTPSPPPTSEVPNITGPIQG